MIKFQLVTSLLFLGVSCSTVSQFNLVGIKNQLNGSYSAGIIASRIKGELYLKGVCLNKYMDDPTVATIIRETLVNFGVLLESEATCVQPEHLLLTGRNQYKLKVFDGASTAWSKTITLIVEDHSDITTWSQNDNIFHFIAYFTPGDYLWLRNILMHDPKFSTDEWFLGCLVQILNDNHFSSRQENIPWTDSLTKIFRWGNRLEEHMGDFGPWDCGLSETMNQMINWKKNKRLVLVHNDELLIYTLRDFFNYQTTENNFGMMMNLEWDWSRSSHMSLKLFYVW